MATANARMFTSLRFELSDGAPTAIPRGPPRFGLVVHSGTVVRWGRARAAGGHMNRFPEGRRRGMEGWARGRKLGSAMDGQCPIVYSDHVLGEHCDRVP